MAAVVIKWAAAVHVGCSGRLLWALREEEEERLDGQALTAFSAAGVDDSATAPGLHTHQETVSTGAAGLGGLVSTFHDLVP